jgi:PAS domain S-box-containing protein
MFPISFNVKTTDVRAKLLPSQQHVRLILDSVYEGIIELDMERCIIFANRAALSILGRTDEELVGRNFIKAVLHTGPDGETCAAESCVLCDALKRQEAARIPNIEFIRKDGSRAPVTLFTAPVIYDGRWAGQVLTFADRTENIETQKTMNAIYETTHNGYMTFTEEGKPLDCNPAMLRLLGAGNKKDFLDNFMAFSPAFQPNGKTSDELFREVVKRSQKEDYFVFEWTHKDAVGSLIPCEVTLTSIRVNQRRLILGAVHDVRDRIKAGEAMDRQREQLQNILNSTPIVLALIADEKIHTVNKNGTKLLGVSPGDPAASIFADEEERKSVFGLLAGGEPVKNHPVKLKDKAGNLYDTYMSMMFFFYEGKRVLLAWIVDVTELTLARKAAEQGARAKSEFLASMSHEIRTPMNAILGMSHLCLQTEMTEKQQNYLDKIHSAATSLLSVINDILDFSKIEAGKLTLEKAPFRLSETLKNVRDLVALHAETKKLLFLLDVDGGAQEYLVGDSLRLQQILLNLCNNAIKFTERGEIVLRVSSDAPVEEWKGHRTARLRFSVRDTGIGISEEQMKRLFTPFTQADSSTTRKYGGSGLGLSICKHLVESMDGAIEVESVPGRGSAFSFTVKMEAAGREEPAVSQVQQEQQVQQKQQKQQTRQDRQDDPNPGEATLEAEVLLVEDNLINQEIALELLRQKGAIVDVAGNGEEAVDAVKKKRYDLIFMDVQMPVMDGLEATERIRALPGCGADTLPVLAMTAHAMQEDYDKSIAAGMNGHITKPIDVDELYSAYFKWGVFGRARRQDVDTQDVSRQDADKFRRQII